MSTTSVCIIKKNNHQTIIDFGLFLIDRQLSEDQVTIFSLPEKFYPKNMVYFTVASTDGEFCGTCSIDTNGVIKMGHTPNIAKYFVGQVSYFMTK